MVQQSVIFQRRKICWIIGFVLFVGVCVSCSKQKTEISDTIQESENLILVRDAFLQGDWDKVIQYGEEEVKKAPNNVILCHLLASAYDFRGDLFLKKAFEFNNEKQVLFERKDSISNILDWAEKLNAKYPQNYYVRLYLGNIYRNIGWSKNAITSFKKAIEINPELYEVYYELGLIYLNKKSWNKAERYFKKAIEYSRNARGKCFMYLSEVYAGLKEDRLVIDYSLRAKEKMPDYSPIYMFLGTFYANKGDLKMAKNYWEEVIRLDPNGEDGRLAQEWILSLPKK